MHEVENHYGLHSVNFLIYHISFIDIKNLTEDNISIVNDAPWIISKRQKTGVPFQIKLMDIPMLIIERYKSFRKDNHLFNIGNLDSINKRIKKVAAMCGIKKRVSFHVSRHSCNCSTKRQLETTMRLLLSE